MGTNGRITSVLLVTCSVTLPATIILLAYFFDQSQEIQALKLTLLSETELQTRLLKSQPLDHSVTPHIVDEIGFVLNPFMKQSTYKARDGDVYRINSIGLRGEEIKGKAENRYRVLIVGDSMVFGWKLSDEDRLTSFLNRMEAKTKNKSLEFLTIALPGWNVKSELAFLENHIRLLEPDLVIWSMISNDIEDVPGVVSPGLLAHWASPQDVDQSPFAGLTAMHKRSGSFMPVIAERREKNIDLVSGFTEKYGVPVMLVANTALLNTEQEFAYKGKRIIIPDLLLNDERWPISETDFHPTAWANHMLAVGIASKLARMDLILDIPFNEEQLKMVAAFQAMEFKETRMRIREELTSNALLNIPSYYESHREELRESILFGVRDNGLMSKAGTLFLRDLGESRHLLLRMKTSPLMDRYPGFARFTVRNRLYELTEKIVEINQPSLELRLDLPANRSEHRVYEISWRFNYLHCTRHNTCGVGLLESVKFE